MKRNICKNVHSDFWLDEFEVDKSGSEDAVYLIRLSMARRAIANFVSILTGKSIPVTFNSKNQNRTDGNFITLSSDIVEKKDFDPAVGLSLHEGSHVLLTDFNVLVTLWQSIPRDVYVLAEKKGLSKKDVAEYVKGIFNYVEDRFIDNYVYNSAPGYRGYYLALYNKYFHSDKISEMLKSKMYRTLDLISYDTRLINLTNRDTDLEALPDLRKIAEILDVKNINRLKTSDDRFQTALDISRIIFENIQSEDDSKQSNNKPDGNSPGGSGGGGIVEPSDDIDDIIGGEDTEVKSAQTDIAKDVVKKTNDGLGISKTKQDAIEKAIEKQKKFISGDVKQKSVTGKQSKILDQIDNAGITIVNVGKVIDDNGTPLTKGVDCIVVKNLTKELLFSDQFPCKSDRYLNTPLPEQVEAINRGIRMGVVLGRRLKIRNEINSTKYMRKSTGKIDRRVISDLGFDNENIFYRSETDRYKNAFIHISLDASGSMVGQKWRDALTTVVAICKAASMINNLRVSVSIRSTTKGLSNTLPYVAMVYDSEKDSFSKIRSLFPHIHPNGCTPEGLCFEAIMDCLADKSQDNDFYFLNFSDGEPAYTYTSDGNYYIYDYDSGSKHTRRQVNMIRGKGYKVLSYFIKTVNQYTRSNLSNPTQGHSCFKLMYGKDARFIDVTNILGVAKTMNDMFLEKERKI